MGGLPPVHVFWLIVWAVYLFGVYGPSARRFRRSRIAEEHTRLGDALLDFAAFFAWQVFPLIHIFSDWFSFADLSLPAWTPWLGAVLLAAAFVVLLRAYRDLGASWSPKIDVRESQQLVTDGIYRRVRHPIYAGIWLWALANALLLHNWLAGPSLLVVFAALYFTRTPREEAMMRARFGSEYEAYMARTGRLLPRRGA